MKIQLDIIENPIKDDILIFDGKNWKPVSNKTFLYELNRNIIELQLKNIDLQERLNKIERELAYNRGDITEEEYNGVVE